MCVSSCKNLIPYSFLYVNDTVPESVLNKCERNCSLTERKYVNTDDPVAPTCVASCGE